MAVPAVSIQQLDLFGKGPTRAKSARVASAPEPVDLFDFPPDPRTVPRGLDSIPAWLRIPGLDD